MWACFTPPSPPSHLEYERSTLPSRSPPPPSLKTPIRGQRSSSLVSTSVALMKDSKHICKVSTVPPRARASALGQIDKRPRLPYYHRAPTSTYVPAHLDSHTRTLARAPPTAPRQIGLPCCNLGLKVPTTLIQGSAKFLCFRGVTALPFNKSKYVDGPVCACCCLQCMPNAGCAKPPPTGATADGGQPCTAETMER